ncbi:uncharacterized protein [Diadema setosum]|uniref:uncharacterized protein n=1 Tax=Diadema setosum TaxID=31175 RepID=UPI003B3A549C
MKCRFCSSYYNTWEVYRQHLNNHHETTITGRCRICGREVENQRALDLHHGTHHPHRRLPTIQYGVASETYRKNWMKNRSQVELRGERITKKERRDKEEKKERRDKEEKKEERRDKEEKEERRDKEEKEERRDKEEKKERRDKEEKKEERRDEEEKEELSKGNEEKVTTVEVEDEGEWEEIFSDGDSSDEGSSHDDSDSDSGSNCSDDDCSVKNDDAGSNCSDDDGSAKNDDDAGGNSSDDDGNVENGDSTPAKPSTEISRKRTIDLRDDSDDELTILLKKPCVGIRVITRIEIRSKVYVTAHGQTRLLRETVDIVHPESDLCEVKEE